jgi:hypothetical protein
MPLQPGRVEPKGPDTTIVLRNSLKQEYPMSRPRIAKFLEGLR